MPIPRLPLLTIALFLMLITSVAVAAWEEIIVDDDLLQDLFVEDELTGDATRRGFVDDQGIIRFPGCSAPMPVGVSGASELPAQFSFFVDRGAGPVGEWLSEDLLIYFAGGGACWDAGTCVGSLLGPAPSYFPVILETAQGLEAASQDLLPVPGAGGILTRRTDNPFASFAKVYVPYCTGDVHVGSSDTVYEYPPESDTQWSIRHRGFDNLLVVLKWLQIEQQREKGALGPIDDLTVAGSSAGGYAALFNFPVIRDALGEDHRYSIVVDSANGVLTNDFLDRAFGPPGEEGVWAAKGNLDPLVQEIVDREPADSLWVDVFKAIGHTYRDSRVSQSTSAYDAVQALFLLTMQQVAYGNYVPSIPPTEAELFAALLDWSTKARSAMLETAFSVFNYRRYLGAGTGHINLLDPPSDIVEFATTNFFEEDSARNVRYVDWLDDMLNNRRQFFRTDWRNLSCFPRCLE